MSAKSTLLEGGVLHKTLRETEVDRLYMLRRELLRLRKAAHILCSLTAENR